ncbi:hypothetical protein [Tahibacter caeni]|uniref:hypothetical protein n=1 Tax=Tahibacter caeni TaxID=1453545 RepID=UPI0021487CE6|nr:hypothetical protein [Tahibacter caeni]
MAIRALWRALVGLALIAVCAFSRGASPPAAESGPPEIAGLRLGMKLADAMSIVKRRMPKATINASEGYRTGDPGLDSLGPQSFTAQTGVSTRCYYGPNEQDCPLDGVRWIAEDFITADTPGARGEETLTAIWRKQRFAPADRPSVEATAIALMTKYGEPQLIRGEQGKSVTMSWARGEDGEAIGKGNPLLDACVGSGFDADSSASIQRFRRGCGLTIQAKIIFYVVDTKFVEVLHVAMADQDHWMTVNEQLKKRLDGIRRDKQAEALKKANSKPVDL